jgi:hypothetical protein
MTVLAKVSSNLPESNGPEPRITVLAKPEAIYPKPEIEMSVRSES